MLLMRIGLEVIDPMFKRIYALVIALCCFAGVCHAESAGSGVYRIEVDVTNQITTVYRTADRTIVRQMICSSGTETRTPLGKFPLERPRTNDREPWYYIGNYRCYVKYPTRITGSILFHSLPYARMEMSAIDLEALEALGTKASHGCIRLRWKDAQWIAENCPEGTVVVIYNGAAKREALRQLLLKSSYIQREGMTYSDYLQTADDGGDAFSIGLGSTGDGVAALQSHLSNLGYLSGDITGKYDEATVFAVMRYQAACDLTVSGVANGALMERITDDDE